MQVAGSALISQVTQATGLPPELVTKELLLMIEKAGKSPQSLTVEELRAIVADHMQDVLLALKDHMLG